LAQRSALRSSAESIPRLSHGRAKGPGYWSLWRIIAATLIAVYTVRFAEAIYVLHAFQKKSTHGIATSRRDIDLVNRRLRAAQHDYENRYEKNK
jgi:hypothetical protein